VRHFVDRWDGDGTLTALLRVGVTHESAAERMREIFASQLVGLLTGWTANEAAARVRAGLVASQILGLALCRYVLSLPPVAALSRDEVVGWLAPTVQRYLTAPGP
jgi:hypothetical protein